MKLRRFLRTPRLSILAALTVAIAAVGLTAFVASAGADFTIETGSLKLTNGGPGTPPSGSWVELTSKDAGGEPFNNPASGASNHFLTLILGSGAGDGLKFGTAQPNGGIFGPLTYFGEAIPTDLFDAVTLTGSAPLLVFSGIDTQTVPRILLAGSNLLGLFIAYAGGLYNVQTEYNTIKDTQFPLRGLIVGNALSKTNPATILLNWSTGLLEPGFSLYNALFNWVGTYLP